MARRMQCKDIPVVPILRKLAENPGAWHCHWAEWPEDRRIPFPDGTPDKLRLAKMRQLLARGLVVGCNCGCRGDWNITAAGWRALGDKAPTPRPVHGETWLMPAELAELRAAIGEEATDGTDALE